MPCAEIRGGDFCSPHPACGHLLPSAEKGSRRWNLCPGQRPRPFQPVPVFYSERKFSYPLFPMEVLRRCYARRGKIKAKNLKSDGREFISCRSCVSWLKTLCLLRFNSSACGH